MEEGGVYSREEYAKKEFWDARFSESEMSFDWYAQWEQLKAPILEICEPAETSVLMVGCGNSKLSAEMADAGFRSITSIDISEVVIDQMREKHRESHPDLVWAVEDATALSYSDDSFDLVIDKGTFDALACSADKTISEGVLREMARVAKGWVVEISNGDEAKRLPLFAKVLSEAEVTAKRIELSSLSTLINILRAGLKDKPLSKATENPALLKYALSFIDIRNLEAKAEIGPGDDAKQKLRKMMLKVRVKQKSEELEEMRRELDLGEEASSQLEGYSPKRQDFVMAYLLRV